jgi:integrase
MAKREKRANGDGSVYKQTYTDPKTKQPAVRWRGAMVVGWTSDEPPKPRKKYVSGKDEAEVKKKLRKLRSDLEQGRVAADPGTTASDWLEYWLEHIAKPSIRGTSYEAYSTVINHWAVPYLGRRLKLEQLTTEHLEGLFRQMAERGSGRSAPGVKRVLSTALRVAVDRGRMVKNPAKSAKVPPVEEKEIEPLTAEEAKAVLAAAAGKRNEARWSVALALGLRQGEALGLTWDCVDLDAGRMRVRHQVQRIKGVGLRLVPVKSRAGRRPVSLPPTLLAALKTHRARQSAERLREGERWTGWTTQVPYPDGRVRTVELVFPNRIGGPIQQEDDWRDWKALIVAAGLGPAVDGPVGRKTSKGYVSGKGLARLHDARHTAATLLLVQGVDVRVAMAIFGWSEASMAARYGHVVAELRDAAAAQMESALWGSSTGSKTVSG